MNVWISRTKNKIEETSDIYLIAEAEYRNGAGEAFWSLGDLRKSGGASRHALHDECLYNSYEIIYTIQFCKDIILSIGL